MDVDFIRQLELLPQEETLSRIQKAREKWGKQVCLLAHLYQRKTIADLADFTGDSFGLSKKASEFEGGKYIVFAGVRFMAESAAILARAEQKVIHPDPQAGCPMADMASLDEVERAWKRLSEIRGKDKLPIPVTYMNSTADIKAFCGKYEGTICTSSNAPHTFKWAYEKQDQVFFLPDEHLGRNTAIKMGVKPSEMAVWDPEKEDGGESEEKYRNAKVVLWHGYCPVHQKFKLRDVLHIKEYFPKAKIIVHPECPKEIVEQADAVGSTGFICDYIAKHTSAGDEIFIGTEVNLIKNLQAEYRDRKISGITRSLCLTMYQITLGRILYSLENLETMDTVELDPDTVYHSRVALDRMLSLI